MHVDQASRWLADALAVDAHCPERSVVDRAMTAITRLLAVLESQRVACFAALRALTPVPGVDLATGSGIDGRDASQIADRARLIADAPAFGDALARGAIAGQHLDRLAGSLRRLSPGQRDKLLDRTDELVGVAQITTPDAFNRHLKHVEHQLAADGGESRLAIQKGKVRLRTSYDDDGMLLWRLALDPETAVWASGRLRAAADALHASGTLPPGAPHDLRERSSFVNAHALLNLLRGAGGGAGRPEYVIVEDRRTPPASAPVIDTGQPERLPDSTLAALRQRCRETTITFDGDRLVSTPGEMNLGRRARLASAPQRRVLRAMYVTCAIPGCPTTFDNCTIHHVDWWEHDGRTDLERLLPVCWQDHHNIHQHGWQLELGRGHQLRVRVPNGQTLTGGPNRLAYTLAMASERNRMAPPMPCGP